MFKRSSIALIILSLILMSCQSLTDPNPDVSEASVEDEAFEETPSDKDLGDGSEGEESVAIENPEPLAESSDLDTPIFDVNVAEYEMITLLPPDAIRSIDNPEFLSMEEADGLYDDNEIVIGVVFNGEARAYSTRLLSVHEIVNDNVGGKKIAVTW